MIKIIFLLAAMSLYLQAEAQRLEQLIQKTGISFRGLDTYGDQALWVSGSKGTVGKSMDQGKSWTWVSPSGYQNYDFRDIEVFSANEAVVMSAGSPALVLETRDGGFSWREVWKDTRAAIFLDGMDFQDSVGLILGDPIDGIFQLLISRNSGRSWQDISLQVSLQAQEGEAAFAASGTSLKIVDTLAFIGSGGSKARLHVLNMQQLFVRSYPTAMRYGQPSQGIFSLDFRSPTQGIVVGGDYLDDKNATDNVCITNDGGLSWQQPIRPVGGYRSIVQYINNDTLIAAGTSGVDLSVDGGQHWSSVSTASVNTLAVTSSGKHIYLADGAGRLIKLHL